MSVNAADFERVLRDQLAVRDKTRQGRLFHPDTYRLADEAFVAAVMAAAGLAAADGGKALRRARRASQQDEAIAFGDA